MPSLHASPPSLAGMPRNDPLVSRVRRRLASHLWNGRLRWKPKEQLVYESGDSRPDFVTFNVPYLCAGTPFDYEGFWDYPARVGWRIRRFDRACHSGRCPPGLCLVSRSQQLLGESGSGGYGLLTPSISREDGHDAVSASELVIFLQAWLFFGALAEACSLCGLPLSFVHTLASPDDGFICMAALNGLPQRLFSASRAAGHAGKKALKRKLHALVRQVQLMITRVGYEDEYQYTFPECEVLLSIHLLLRILSLTVLCHSASWNLDPKDEIRLSIADVALDWNPEGRMQMGGLIFEKLLRSGWCRSELHLMQPDEMVFSSYIQRLGEPRNHGQCANTICLAYQTNETTYRTMHTVPGCTCDLLPVDDTELSKALAAGKVPKVLLSHDGDPRLRVIADNGYPYIAFSHVWADGLGNPFGNALPCCQIHRLQGLVTQLRHLYLPQAPNQKPIALWIDTLCIPVATHLKEHRKMAIRFLGRTFNEAAAVLVLDRELCLFESRKASILELGVRIKASGWMKRLWTLQEAALAIDSPNTAGKLYFQMGDGIVLWNKQSRAFEYSIVKPRHRPRKPSALSDTVRDVKRSLTFELDVEVAMSDRLPSVYDLQRGSDTPIQKLLWAIRNRTTSKAEDEAICLASLLGLDVTGLLSVPTAAERMSAFYLLVRELPTGIIFANAYFEDALTRNLSFAPFRWAPASLLLLEDPMSSHMFSAAQRFSNVGHRILCHCEPDGLHIQHGGFVFSQEVVLRQTCILEAKGHAIRYHLTWYGKAPGVSRRDVALICQAELYPDAVVVSIVGHLGTAEGAELCVTIIGYANVKLFDVAVEPGESIVQGKFTDPDQKWCIT